MLKLYIAKKAFSVKKKMVRKFTLPGKTVCGEGRYFPH